MRELVEKECSVTSGGGSSYFIYESGGKLGLATRTPSGSVSVVSLGHPDNWLSATTLGPTPVDTSNWPLLPGEGKSSWIMATIAGLGVLTGAPAMSARVAALVGESVLACFGQLGFALGVIGTQEPLLQKHIEPGSAQTADEMSSGSPSQSMYDPNYGDVRGYDEAGNPIYGSAFGDPRRFTIRASGA